MSQLSTNYFTNPNKDSCNSHKDNNDFESLKKQNINQKESGVSASYSNILNQKFSSARVKELQLYASIKFNKTKKAKELIESLSYKDLNMKNYDFRNISDNLEILNPVLTERDGLAEVFYNISSWYYQKD